MAKLNRKEALSMDYSYRGEPFVWVMGNSADDSSGMDYSYGGEPFVVVYGNPIKVLGVSWFNVDKFLGTSSAKVSKLAGVETV